MKRPLILSFFLVFALQGCGVVANHFNQEGAESFGKRDLQAAKQKFKRAILFDPHNPSFRNNLGYALYLLKDLQASEMEFQAALNNKPDQSLDRQIRINESILYSDRNYDSSKSEYKNWNEKGIKVLQGLLAEDPDNAEFHMKLGFAYFRATNPGGGFSELEKAVQLANPRQVAKYSPDPINGSLLILQQVQQFYVKMRYFKKVREIQNQIAKLKKTPFKGQNPPE